MGGGSALSIPPSSRLRASVSPIPPAPVAGRGRRTRGGGQDTRARGRGRGGRVRRAGGREGSARRCPPPQFPSRPLIDSGGFEILLPIKSRPRRGVPAPLSGPLTAGGGPDIKSIGRPLPPAPLRGSRPRRSRMRHRVRPRPPRYHYDYSPPLAPPGQFVGFMVPEQEEGKGFTGGRAIKLSGSPW